MKSPQVKIKKMCDYLIDLDAQSVEQMLRTSRANIK